MQLCVPKQNGGMGFCDPHSFNLTMLANKSGGSFDNSESIYAQVLRAEYYPPSDILKAGPKNGSSFICQSLVAAFNLLDASIFGIPSSPTRMVIASRGHHLLSKVSELIDPYTASLV